jgi:hypothetical protein
MQAVYEIKVRRKPGTLVCVVPEIGGHDKEIDLVGIGGKPLPRFSMAAGQLHQREHKFVAGRLGYQQPPTLYKADCTLGIENPFTGKGLPPARYKETPPRCSVSATVPPSAERIGRALRPPDFTRLGGPPPTCWV